jgi:hypothetical protein
MRGWLRAATGIAPDALPFFHPERVRERREKAKREEPPLTEAGQRLLAEIRQKRIDRYGPFFYATSSGAALDFHNRYLFAAVLACLLSLPARADEATDAIDRLDVGFALYVEVPAVPPALAAALVRAKRRGAHMVVMIPESAAGNPQVSILRNAGIRVALTERVAEAVMVYDMAGVAEGPDAEHMTVRVDRQASERRALEIFEKLMDGLDKQERL